MKKMYSLVDLIREVLKKRGIDLKNTPKIKTPDEERKEINRISEMFKDVLKKNKKNNISWYDIGKNNAEKAKNKNMIDKRIQIAFFENEKKELYKMFKDSTRVQRFLNNQAEYYINEEENEIEKMREAYFTTDDKIRKKTDEVIIEWFKAQNEQPSEKEAIDMYQKINQIISEFYSFSEEEQDEIDEEAEKELMNAEKTSKLLGLDAPLCKTTANKEWLEIDKILQYPPIMARKKDDIEFEERLERKKEEELKKLTYTVFSKILREIVDIDEEKFKKDVEEKEQVEYYGIDIMDITSDERIRYKELEKRLKDANNYFKIKDEWVDICEYFKAKAKEWKDNKQ